MWHTAYQGLIYFILLISRHTIVCVYTYIKMIWKHLKDILSEKSKVGILQKTEKSMNYSYMQ